MLPQLTNLTSRHYPVWLIRVLRIALFTVLIAISAKISIPIPGTPVPITAQVLAVLVTGMVLGPVEGFISVAVYLGAIVLNIPVDAKSAGSAALFRGTAGYLIALGIVAVIVDYIPGVIGLMPFYANSLEATLVGGVAPFVLVDFGKVLLAASLVKLGRESWLRWLAPELSNKI
jgi:biotin transport system substrate-specific component